MKHKLLLLVLSLLLISKNGLAFDFEKDGIYYNHDLSTMTASVTYGDSKYSGDVIIPPSVTIATKTLDVTSIGDSAFLDCTSLTSINIPNSVTSIGEKAFYYCLSLASIDIPNSVTCIGGYAFGLCPFQSLTIPNSVTSIGDGAFYGCHSLTSVIIPNSVTSIGSIAFADCSLTSIIIPNSVTSIGSGDFLHCPLTSITIPNNVTSINFYDCTSLTSIYSNIIDPQPSQATFSSTVYANATLYVPEGTLEKYQTTNGWKDFSTIVEDPSLGNETSDVKQTSADNLTINVSNGQVSVSGVEDKTLVSVFDINGTLLGSTCSSNGNAVIRTNLPQNAIVITKVGNKSFKTIMK